MNVNPAAKAYTNLGILDDVEKTAKPSMGSGLLSRSFAPKEKAKSNEPRDRVRDYVSSIRTARKQITNG